MHCHMYPIEIGLAVCKEERVRARVRACMLTDHDAVCNLHCIRMMMLLMSHTHSYADMHRSKGRPKTFIYKPTNSAQGKGIVSVCARLCIFVRANLITLLKAKEL